MLLLLPQEEDASHSAPDPAWGSSHGTSPPSLRNSSCTAPAWVPSTGSGIGSSSAGSSLPTCPARTLLQHRLPEGPQPPSGMPLPQGGLLHGLQVDLCLPVAPRYQNGATQSQYRGETWDVNAGKVEGWGKSAAGCPGFLYFKGSTEHGTQQANHFCCHSCPTADPIATCGLTALEF